MDNHNNVVNIQQTYDLSATLALTPQWTMSVSLPYVDASWSIPLPVAPTPGERNELDAQGIGDLVVTARRWVRDVASHQKGNLSLGFGIKAPTGRDDVKDDYADITGGNVDNKAVDMSIQPGDGGWGIVFDIQGFKRIGRTVILGSGTYLANPRDTNGTPSIVVGLGVGSNPALRDKLVNTVPDQYLLRFGAARSLGRSGLYASGLLRMEGLPRYDLIGPSHGFRRPGYEVFFEPGLTWARGVDSWSISLPLALTRARFEDPYTGARGDATFPDSILLVSWGHVFRRGAGPGPSACVLPPDGD
jgi:hypothetical protein